MNTPKLGFTVQEFCKATGLGKSKVYELLSAGQLEAVKCGRRTLIVTPPNTFLSDLPRLVPAFPSDPRLIGTSLEGQLGDGQ